MKSDIIVLGAGMVGISAALHLQKRGKSVTLIDRRGPAEETSYGNTGVIQREGIVPYMFPRDWNSILSYALNRSADAVYHLSALPRLAPWLVRYWMASTPERTQASAQAMMPLVQRCIEEHEPLMQEAGIGDVIRRTGYVLLYRSRRKMDEAIREKQDERTQYGVNFTPLDASALTALEPHLRNRFAGAVHMPDPVSVADPGAVGKAYARLFERNGGLVLEGDARSLEETSSAWRVATRKGWWEGRDVVVALGPWSNDVFRPLGYRLPLAWKRGYHAHYAAGSSASLGRPVIDTEKGYAMSPMSKGIRLTTGAEFALRDAPKTPVQIARVEPLARDIFPLADRIDADPWLGSRPCLPDMLPVIGPAPRHPGLWFCFGHHHLGFTLGPVSGRLLAEMLLGGAPFTDPAPYRASRF